MPLSVAFRGLAFSLVAAAAWLLTAPLANAQGVAEPPPADAADTGPVLSSEATESGPVESGPAQSDPAQSGEPPMAMPADGGMKTLAVAALRGWSPLMDDLGYLGGLVGRPDQARGIEGMIALFTQGKGLQGLDKGEPWGVVIQSNGMAVVPVVCLPIDDLESILQIAQAFGVMADDAGGGVTEISVPQSPTPLFVKQVGSWVYVSQTAESLDVDQPDPSETFNALVDEYDVGVRAFVQNIPALFREMALGALRQGVQEGLQREDDESDEDFEARERLAASQLDQLVDVIEGIDELTVGVAINEAIGKGLVADFALTAVEGSDIAKQLAAAAESETRFTGFGRDDATLRMAVAATTPPEVLASQLEQTKAGLGILRAQMLKSAEEELELSSDESREKLAEALNDLFDVYEAIALKGEVDSALVIDAAPGRVSALGALQAESTDKIEPALKKLAEVAAAEIPELPPVEWGVATHAGVTLHSVTLPVPPGLPAARELIGDELKLAIGVGADAVYVAAGEGWLERVSAAIDESAAAGPTPVKPVTMSVSVTSLGKLAAAFDAENRALAQMFVDALGESEGDDHLHLTVEQSGLGVRYRARVEEGVLRAAGALAEAAARQAGAGGPPPF